MRDERAIVAEAEERFGPLIRNVINPGTDERDRKSIALSREQLRAAAQAGIVGFNVEKEFGGEGRDLYDWGVALQTLGYLCTDASFCLVISAYAAVLNKIVESRSDYIRARYLEPMLRGDKFGANAFSDGNDVFSFKTKSVRQADGSFLVNGMKPWVTGAQMADVFITYVANEQGDMSALLVEREDPGVRVVPTEAMGMRAAGLAELHFENVRIPAERVLAAQDGLSHGQRFLNSRRLILVCGCLGAAGRALDDCVKYLNGTTRYGRPLADMQRVQASVGRMVTLLETSRITTRYCLERLAENRQLQHWDPEISATKFHVTESIIELARSILYVVGGNGYGTAYGFERYVRDFVGLIAGAGAQDILQVDLGVNYMAQLERSSRRATRGSK